VKIQPLARSLVTNLATNLGAARTGPFLADAGVTVCALAIFFALVRTVPTGWANPFRSCPSRTPSGPCPSTPSTPSSASPLLTCSAWSSPLPTAIRPPIAPHRGLDDCGPRYLQSIPVLSFLPPVVLAMVALVPGHQMGIELGVILLIFTGQVWNLSFSFYSSLKSIPKEMIEASRIYRYSPWQRFWQLEMPYSAIGLVWNSIVSVAGGWFALIACEMFTMGDRNFQLPAWAATSRRRLLGDMHALVAGFAVVILIVVATDQLIWRPLIAWSDKFKFEQVESATASLLRFLSSCKGHPAQFDPGPCLDPRRRAYLPPHGAHQAMPHRPAAGRWPDSRKISGGLWVLPRRQSSLSAGGAVQAILMLRTVTWPDLRLLLGRAGATFLRVNAALAISALWTIPVGVAIGLNPKLARIVQP